MVRTRGGAAQRCTQPPTAALHALAGLDRPLGAPRDVVENPEQVLRAHERAGINLDALATKVQSDGAASFVASWQELMTVIATKSKSLATW